MYAGVADRPEQYRALGLQRGRVQPWEDGMRTTGGRGSYEWWYFDSHLEDGSTLVIVFYTKPMTEPGRPLSPLVNLFLDRPDGAHLERVARLPARAFAASDQSCDVRIGPNTFRGDLSTYAIHVEIADVRADLTLAAALPAWRPETGHLLFGDRGEHRFAWLPAVLEGVVEGTLTIDGRRESIRGSGYHDHNWGDLAMQKLVHDWYWGRARLGPYTVIAAFITAEKAYGYATFPVFFVGAGGKILADDARRVRFEAREPFRDEKTGKPNARLLRYEYDDGERQYRVTFRREKDLVNLRFADQMTGIPGFAARLLRIDSAYIRCTGEVALERLEGGQVVETERAPNVVWERMYLGKTRSADLPPG